jgi:hypothetical protein
MYRNYFSGQHPDRSLSPPPKNEPLEATLNDRSNSTRSSALAALALTAAAGLSLAACGSGSPAFTANDKWVCGVVQSDLRRDTSAADYVWTATAMRAMAPSTTQPLRGVLLSAAQQADDQAVNSDYTATVTGSGSAVVDPSVFGSVRRDCAAGN